VSTYNGLKIQEDTRFVASAIREMVVMGEVDGGDICAGAGRIKKETLLVVGITDSS
jgi:hypothetical protein